ncbi:Ricin-type beta-trefoil lectin domain protein [Vibrio campbellii]|uniref:RICIN domain-containing protein n=1 Tax=Vibrio campbellii TaxID=680 RepID=UPI0005319660|nr:ricin-type beta-trefoil lectin domain protein [Vibrio campbellii]KGR36786.1 Ricin-type beta-trefoil lectin domain protein [Vibrio campbellii]
MKSKYLFSTTLGLLFIVPTANANMLRNDSALHNYTMTFELEPNTCVDIFGGMLAEPFYNGQNVGAWECNGQKNQRFNYIDGQLKASVNTVLDQHSSKDFCLDIKGAEDRLYSEVIMWKCHGGDNQKFKLRNNNAGKYYFQSKNGYCVNFSRSGAFLDTCNIPNDTNQAFTPRDVKKMIHVKYYNDGAYNFTPMIKNGSDIYYSKKHSISAFLSWDKWVSGDVTSLTIGGWPKTFVGRGLKTKTVEVKPGDKWLLESKGSAFNPWIELYKPY